MRTSLAGRTERGVTLIELMMVALIISLMAGISFPAISSGVDALRLRGAGEEAATMITSALNRAERRRVAVEVTVSVPDNLMALTSVEPGYLKRYQPPDGVTIAAILPMMPMHDARMPRRFFIFPGGTAPRMGLLLSNARGARRLVRVDPITGVAESRAMAPDEVLLP